VSTNVNVSSSFLAPILDVYLLEDMLWNLNQVQGRSFEIIKDCLKTLFVAPHLSNKLRSLDYQSPICFLSTHHIQQWNHLWIAILDKCKAWTSIAMVMLGVRSKPPTSSTILV
jgi:hypothetical protein